MTETMNKFNDINHLPLQVFNRTVMLTNIMTDAGTAAAEEYAAQFTESERKQMYIMSVYIKQKGVEQARKDVTKNLELVH